MHRSLLLLLAYGLSGCNACASHDTPPPAPAASAEAEGIEAPAEPPLPRLPRGPCEADEEEPVEGFIRSSSGVAFLFDEPGGLLLETGYPNGEPARAHPISREGRITAEGVVLSTAMPGARLLRVGAQLLTFYYAPCPPDHEGSSCRWARALSTDGREVGQPIVANVRWGREQWRAEPARDAVAVLRTTSEGQAVLERFRIEAQAVVASPIAELTAEARPGQDVRLRLQSFVVEGERWAVLLGEHWGDSSRLVLHSSAHPVPVPVELPHFGNATSFLSLTADGVRIAWGWIDHPARTAEIAFDGEVREAPRVLEHAEALPANAVIPKYPNVRPARIDRVDRAGRRVGEAYLFDDPVYVHRIVAGAGEHLLVVRLHDDATVSATRLTCAEGPPAAAPDPPLEERPDPRRPCGAVACAPSAPTLEELEVAVGAICDTRARGDASDEEWAQRNRDDEGTEVASPVAIEDARLRAHATIACARGVRDQGTARWGFLALQTAEGWTACDLGGGFPSLFDVELSLSEPEVAEWIGGGSPEVVVRLGFGDYASDAGEATASYEERAHVCGLHDGAVVSWGSFEVASASADGPAGDVTRKQAGAGYVPDGEGRVTLRPHGGGPARVLEVARLGCHY